MIPINGLKNFIFAIAIQLTAIKLPGFLSELLVVSAGNGKCGLDDITDWIEFSENIFPACDFATTVSGNSMEPKIFDSDILLIRKTETLDSGDIGIFKIDEDVFCKKLQLNHLTNEVILKSLNPCYAPRYLSKEELENFKIIGKVVGKLDYHF